MSDCLDVEAKKEDGRPQGFGKGQIIMSSAGIFMSTAEGTEFRHVQCMNWTWKTRS